LIYREIKSSLEVADKEPIVRDLKAARRGVAHEILICDDHPHDRGNGFMRPDAGIGDNE